MRIAIEGSTWINRRGYGRFTREMTRALSRSGASHDFTLVLDSGAARAPDLPDLPRRLVPTTEAVVDAATATGARSITDLWRMGRALSARDFGVVLFPTTFSYVPVLSKAKVAVVVHDTLPESNPTLVLGSRRSRWLWTMKTALACRRADLVVTVSEASAADIRRHLPVGSTPIVVVTEGAAQPFGHETAATDAGLVQRVVPQGGSFILYVGGWSPHKRVPLLIEAFGRATRSGWLGASRLVLAGPGSDDPFAQDPGIAEAVRALGPIQDRLVWAGYVADETLAALYRAARCVVMPSLGEGFGLPALEAMTCGAAVVVARTAALTELCGEAADYFDDAASLAQTLAALGRDEAHRERLRARGLERARASSWDAGARRLLESFDRWRIA